MAEIPNIIDTWDGRFCGQVRQILYPNGYGAGGEHVLHESANLVVDSAMEVMIQALMGDERISGVTFGKTGGKPVTRGTRVVRGPVAFSRTGEFTDTRPFASRDSKGLRTIGTWTAVLSPSQNLTYDTLGLVSSADLLFAAVSFPEVTLSAGESIAVQWTILLRGN